MMLDLDKAERKYLIRVLKRELNECKKAITNDVEKPPSCYAVVVQDLIEGLLAKLEEG